MISYDSLNPSKKSLFLKIKSLKKKKINKKIKKKFKLYRALPTLEKNKL